MPSKHMKARRYQLNKDTVAIVERDHPWIFRDQLSTAASVFRDGDRLRLVDGANRVVGYGIFEAEGAIAIRVVRRGAAPPDAAWLRGKLAAALARRGLGSLAASEPPPELAHHDEPVTRGTARAGAETSAGAAGEPAAGEPAAGEPAAGERPRPEPLAARTDGIRLVHGESDGIPAVVIDRFGDTLVAQSYARGADAMTRFAAIAIARELELPHVLLRPAHRRRAVEQPARVLRGAPPAIARFTEDGLSFAVDLETGQKSGTYLDLRGLRRTIATAPLAGARVLNLFAYSGMLGRAAEVAGAASITQVDASDKALAFAASHHVDDPAKHTFVTADVFQWLPALDPGAQFDLVIVDPPSMTSNKKQVPAVLAGYRKLYRAAAPHVRPGGLLVAACCTSRVERGAFHKTVSDTLGAAFVRERVLPPEPDHPIGFPQADYLKIALWRKR